MAYVSTGRRQGFSFGNFRLINLATLASGIWGRLVKSHNQRKTFKTLLALSPEQRKDIGVTPSDFHHLLKFGHLPVARIGGPTSK